MLKSYFVKSENISSLQNALDRMIEYAKFLEEETGRSNPSFVDEILEENNIEVEVE